jgi:hypothetical protein
MVHNGDYYPLAYLDLGWQEYMVLAVDHPVDVLDRIRLALASRGYHET